MIFANSGHQIGHKSGLYERSKQKSAASPNVLAAVSIWCFQNEAYTMHMSELTTLSSSTDMFNTHTHKRVVFCNSTKHKNNVYATSLFSLKHYLGRPIHINAIYIDEHYYYTLLVLSISIILTANWLPTQILQNKGEGEGECLYIHVITIITIPYWRLFPSLWCLFPWTILAVQTFATYSAMVDYPHVGKRLHQCTLGCGRDVKARSQGNQTTVWLSPTKRPIDRAIQLPCRALFLEKYNLTH